MTSLKPLSANLLPAYADSRGGATRPARLATLASSSDGSTGFVR